MEMAHPIWNIGLFDKEHDKHPRCKECNKELKMVTKQRLIQHLFSKKHKGSHFTKKYEELLKAQQPEASEGKTRSSTLLPKILIDHHGEKGKAEGEGGRSWLRQFRYQ
jgi:hypothetical protein